MASLELFEDVVGVAQEDGPNAMCAISYPEEYRKLMDIFRAIMVREEKSSRVLELTGDILEWNAAHYTVWFYRRRVVDALAEGDDDGKELYRAELEYAANVAESNPKNYQVWYHRRAMLERLEDVEAAREELEFIGVMLQGDAKNYHAWSHRLWVLKSFNCWESELDFCETRIKEDAFNNSAWTHRYNAVTLSASEIPAQREVEFAMSVALQHPGNLRNESPWTYALAFAKMNTQAFTDLMEACDSVLSVEDDDAASPLEPLDRACARLTKLELLATSQHFDEAATCADILATEEDRFRTRYWTRRSHTLRNKARQQRHEPPLPSLETTKTASSMPWAPAGLFPFGSPPTMETKPSNRPPHPPTPDQLRGEQGL